MKKIVCLQNVYFEGRFLSAGTDTALPDDVARNWVERGLAKFVGEETPVNPPAVPPVVKPAEKPEVKPEEKAVVKYDFATEIPKAEETPVAVDDTPKRGRPPKKKHGGKRK